MLLLSLATFAQTGQTYQIGILIDQMNPEMSPLLEQLKSEVVAVVGEDANIQFPQENILINGFDVAKAKQNYDQLINNNTDIILAFGVVNNQIISAKESHKKPTILFGAVNRDLHNLDLTNATSGIENFTYLVESESYEEDFKKFKDLTKL